LTDLATPPVDEASAPTEQAVSIPFVSGGPLRWSLRGMVAVSALLAFCLLPVRGLYRATGSSMEEGFMLVFPKLVQQGKTPNVDFLHLYGPGSLDVLALWYRVFGYTLEAQRTFGLLQNLAIVFAVYALTRSWGRVTAIGSGGIAALLIMTPIGLSALAWHGAVAMAMWALVFALRARHTARTLDWVVAGLLGGIALTFRPDIVLAISAALLVAGWTHRRTALKPVSIAAVVGLLPMWIHLLVAGPGAVIDGIVLDPVFRLRAGRELPRPPSWGVVDGALQAVAEGVPPWWGLPAPSASQQLFLWFFAVVIIAVAVPAWAWWRRRRGEVDEQNMVLLAAGVFGLGILPQALQRPDSTHLAWVAVASWPLLAAAIADARGRRTARPSWRPGATGVSIVCLLMLVVAPFFTYRQYVLHTRVSVGDLPLPFLVERDGRRFWFGDAFVASALNEMIVDLDELTEPGDRIVVGPADLSRTIYSDVAVYFLFPELVPATYYIEMDPGLADAEGSGLAQDIETADFLVLTNVWTGWNEPNASSDHLSQEANQAVADNFCLIRAYEENLVMIFERCEGGGGVSPADVPGRYPLPADPAD
jgi:cbb3-type cytochrome oxidase subunit 3